MKERVLAILIIVVAGVAGLLLSRGMLMAKIFGPRPSDIPHGQTVTELEEAAQLVAEKLDIPWELEFLPSGSILVTERPGTLLLITDNGKSTVKVEGVVHYGEGGLQGGGR